MGFIEMASSLSKKRASIISLSERMKVPSNKPKALFGCRHTQATLMCLGFFCCYAIRVTTSVTLEAMIHPETANPDFEAFDWEPVKNLILSSFFWGYICTQIPGSIIAQRWSAQVVFSLALFISGVMTVAFPLGARYGGWEAVCALRVISGLSQGMVMPCLHTLLSKWSPLEERGRLAMFVYSGGWIGNVVCLLSSGLLSASSLGWPSCFYFWGGIAVICGIIFYIFGRDSPADHRTIPLDEKEYIETSLGATEINEELKTPWIAMLTSLPVWALLITQCAQNWGFWMLLTETPSYMSSILGFDITRNGLLTSLPYFAAWIVSFPISFISDLCIRKNIVSTQASRKICNTIGQWIPAFALIGLGYVRNDQPELAIVILTIAVSTNIAAYCGHNVNHMDLSPNFAGTLMGITNCAANICSILAPLIAGVIIEDSTEILQWRHMFFLSAGIYALGNLVFILFGTTKIQSWNESMVSKRNSISIHRISKAPMNVTTIEELKDIEKIS